MAAGQEVRGGDRQRLNELLRANLWPAAGADDLAALADPGKRVRLAVDPPRYRVEEGGPLAFLLPILLGVLLYSSIFTVSSFLLQSVTTEKETRIIEILLTSVRSFDLLLGKVIGLGGLGLLQIGIWSGAGAVLAGGGTLAQIAPGSLSFPKEWLGIGLLYFLAGYFFYASAMAAIGAVAPSLKESGPITLALLLPAWVPFLLLRPILSDPGGALARALSVFPPTAPMVALLRLTSGHLPAWEAALGLLLLVSSGLLVLAAAGRLFRASILLAGSPPSARSLARALRSPPAAA
jgi:ABC-2 type transport system permease protein